MTSENLNTQAHLEKEHQHQLEQIIVGIAKINTRIDEISEKLDSFDKRLIFLERRQDQMRGTTPKASATYATSIENNERFFQPKETKKEENERSTCFCCPFYLKKKCRFYFDDLYNFNTKQINTEVGADPIRFECPCTHPIRYHDRDPNSLETELPAFANPPLRQILYEYLVPPVFQDWFSCNKKKNYNKLDHTGDVSKKD